MHTFKFNGAIYASLSLTKTNTHYIASGNTTKEAIESVLNDALHYAHN